MSGRNGIFGYGLERSKGVPDRTTVFPAFDSESLKMERPEETNPNIDPGGSETKGEKLRATGSGSVSGAADSESWLTMRAHHHGYYEVTEVVEDEVYLWEMRTYDSSTDTPVDHYLDSIWFRIWRDEQTRPGEYTGEFAKVSDFELSVDAHKFVMFKHDMLFLRDTRMGKPVEVAVNAAYTGDWERRGHRRKGDQYGADIYYEVSTAGALGVAKLQWGARTQVTLTSVGTTATATSTVPHDLATGDLVTITGADPAGYNVVDTAVTVTGPLTFTYTIVSVSGAPGTGTIIATVLGTVEHLIADDWMTVLRPNGQRKGTRREPVQIRPVMQAGDVFTLGDGWRVPALAPRPVPVTTDRQRLSGSDLELTIEIDGVPKTELIATSFSLKFGRPREAKEGLGSKYLQDIGEPNESRLWWEITFPRTYVDADFEQALISETPASAHLILYGTPIGDTGEEDFAEFTLPNMSFTTAGTTITSAGDLVETITMRAFSIDGSPLCTERYQNTVASIEPT